MADAYPLTVRLPGAGRAFRYSPNATDAESTVVDLLRAKTPVIEVHYRNRLAATFTLPEWDKLLTDRGQWCVALNKGRGGWSIPQEHFLVHRITAAVEALKDAPEMLSGKKQKVAVAALVERGVPEAEAILKVRAFGVSAGAIVAPPKVTGKKQKVAVAALVARGVSEEEAIRNVRAFGAAKAVFAGAIVAPPTVTGKKQKVAVAVLVARGVSEEEAIRNVRAFGAEKAVFA